MKNILSAVGLFAFLLVPFQAAHADTAAEIRANVESTLTNFDEFVPGGDKLLDASEAALVFPNVIEGAFVFGAEYGEGALVKDGDFDGYYSVFAGSFGLQAGAQSKSIVLLFMTDDSLEKLMKLNGWQIGVDIEVAVIDKGVSDEITSTTFDKPVVAVVFQQKGLLAGFSLNGAKITRIER